MELILIVLLIPSVYFSARFFLLSKNIKNITKDFKYISENIETNRKLTFTNPDNNFEKLLIEINRYLELSQENKNKYKRREEEIKKEIENISHDLRTPLTSIRGYLELMDDETVTEEDKREYISVVERRAKGLQNLIQTFYELSRLENNEYNMNFEIVDINKELKEQILLFYNDLEDKNINVNIELNNSPVYVNIDKNSIERVFYNLIQNAIKYSKDSFNIFLKSNDEEVVILLENNAENLDKDDGNNLFNRFYMKDSARSSQSTGLGLTITKYLVESMNGKIDVEIDEDWIKFNIRFSICEK